MNYVIREKYLQELLSLYGTPDIKVITGVRRCGKSVLLRQFADRIMQTDSSVNIISVNLQDLENDALLEYHALHAYVMDHYRPAVRNVVMIDEIQLCDKFELAVNSLHTKELFDIYLTGSNAFLLSSDLATLFTGRVMEVKVYPFSFAEYAAYSATEDSPLQLAAAFDNYVRVGGMPGAYVYPTEEKQLEYVDGVFKTILLRDLVDKYKIRNKTEFYAIANYMLDNIGNLLSTKKICEILNSSHPSITQKTVDNYLRYLQNAFLLYEAKRFDVRGKKYLKTTPKYYLSDTVFRYAVNGIKNRDFGRVYENMVYVELLRRGYEVYVGKLYQKEIDFVALKRNEKIYIQVSDDISDENTMRREITPLLQIADAYPKMVIANTHHENYTMEGVLITDLANWLYHTT